MTPNSDKMFSRQRGISLIEVLAALMVLAIGLMGMLAMQTRGVQLNQAGYYQSQAMFLAQDMVERIRANREAIDSYVIDLEDFGDPGAGVCFDALAPCTPVQLAAVDLREWKGEITALFPAGDGSVTLGVPSGDLQPVVVLVQYQYEELRTYQLEAML